MERCLLQLGLHAQYCFFFFGMRSSKLIALILAAIMKSFSVKPPAASTQRCELKCLQAPLLGSWSV